LNSYPAPIASVGSAFAATVACGSMGLTAATWLASTDKSIGATVSTLLVVMVGLAVLTFFPAIGSLIGSWLCNLLFPNSARYGVPCSLGRAQ
jgi:hypothetical protein